jgi:phosphate-selective porin
VQRRLGDWTLLGQAMTGTTRIAPEDMVFDTYFNAGYVLAAREYGAWTPVVRLDLFQLSQSANGDPTLNEHGNALTAALNWRPSEHVRVIGEALRIDSTRDQRTLEGLAPRQVDVQVQVAVRLYF